VGIDALSSLDIDEARDLDFPASCAPRAERRARVMQILTQKFPSLGVNVHPGGPRHSPTHGVVSMQETRTRSSRRLRSVYQQKKKKPNCTVIRKALRTRMLKISATSMFQK